MPDGKIFVEYSDRLRSTLLGADRFLGRQTSEFGETPKDGVFFDEENVVAASDYTGPFDVTAKVTGDIDDENGTAEVTIGVLNSSAKDDQYAGTVVFSPETLYVGKFEKQITLSHLRNCIVYCVVEYDAQQGEFETPKIVTTYDDGFNSNSYQSNDTMEVIQLGTIYMVLQQNMHYKIVARRDRALDKINITGRWF